jgi:hypothetical protein
LCAHSVCAAKNWNWNWKKLVFFWRRKNWYWYWLKFFWGILPNTGGHTHLVANLHEEQWMFGDGVAAGEHRRHIPHDKRIE